MAFTKACRLALDELDGKWAYKVLLRAVLNVFCALAIAACAFVLTRKSDFQPEEWKEDHEILMYLPYAGVTIVWNVVNIVYLSNRRKFISPLINIVVDFILAAAAFVLGSMATVVASDSLSELRRNVYSNVSQGDHWVLSTNGGYVLVTPGNVASCPAFPSCESQYLWIRTAHLRSIVALVGCGLVDLSFFLHITLFVWTGLDLFYGTRPKSLQSAPQGFKRDLRISDPVLISAPWTPKPASQTSLSLVPAQENRTYTNTLHSATSVTSLSDVDYELGSPTYWYPGRLPQSNDSIEQARAASASKPPAAPEQPFWLPEIERPPLHQPLFPSKRDHKPKPISAPGVQKHRPVAVSGGSNRPRHQTPKLAPPGSLPGHKHGGSKLKDVTVTTPKGSLNDRGLLERAD